MRKRDWGVVVAAILAMAQIMSGVLMICLR